MFGEEQSFWEKSKQEFSRLSRERPKLTIAMGLIIGGALVGPIYDFEAGLVIIIIDWLIIFWICTNEK